jgi:hypothetical protein
MHVCLPVMAVDAYFASRPQHEREIYDAVVGHLQTVGNIDVEAATVGILVKRLRTFVKLRPKQRWVELPSCSPVDRRPSECPPHRGLTGAACYFFRLRSAADVDEDLRELLTESCLAF